MIRFIRTWGSRSIRNRRSVDDRVQADPSLLSGYSRILAWVEDVYPQRLASPPVSADGEILNSSGDLALPIAMPLRDWLFADASLDSIVSLASVDLDDRSVSIGTRIREAGWSVTGSILDAERDSGR